MANTGPPVTGPKAGGSDWSSFASLMDANKGGEDTRNVAMSRKGELYVTKERSGLSALLTRLAVGFSRLFGADLSAKMHYAESSREKRAASSFSALIAADDDGEEVEGAEKLSLEKIKKSYDAAFKDEMAFRQCNQKLVKDYLLPLKGSDKPGAAAKAKSKSLRRSVGFKSKGDEFARVYNLHLRAAAAKTDNRIISKDFLRDTLQENPGLLQVADNNAVYRTELARYAEQIEDGLGAFARACKEAKDTPHSEEHAKNLAKAWITMGTVLGHTQQSLDRETDGEHKKAAKEFRKLAIGQAIASMAADITEEGHADFQALREAFGLEEDRKNKALEGWTKKAFAAMVDYKEYEAYSGLPADDKRQFDYHQYEFLNNITGGLAIHCDRAAKFVFGARTNQYWDSK